MVGVTTEDWLEGDTIGAKLGKLDALVGIGATKDLLRGAEIEARTEEIEEAEVNADDAGREDVL